MEKILQTFLRRLTNLSRTNRSLLLLRLSSNQFIDLKDLEFAMGKPAFEIIRSLIERKSSIPLAKEVSRDPGDNKLALRLARLDRVEKFIFQERGAFDLYVGWPFVHGKFSDDTPVRAPLIFFPVTLARVKDAWVLKPREEVNVTLNKSFLLAYAYYNKVSLDEDLIEMVLTDLDRDGKVYRTQLYEILRDSKLEINFNSENFTDTISAFPGFKSQEFAEEQKTGVLKLYPEAVLGIFPQAGSYLVPDYVHLLEQETVPDLADFFLKRKEEPTEQSKIRFSEQVKEETTVTPFDLDASQEVAIKEVKKGKSIVVQGPPGTGKSQLICNLVSDYVARGKKVLVVCQKRAALDVVHQRLASIDQADFVGLVHDFKNDRKSIFSQIANQIERLEEFQSRNNSLDAIYLERTFIQASRKIDQAGEELDEFRKWLYDESECGKSIKELYLISSPSRPGIPLNQIYRRFPFTESQEFVRKMSRYFDYHAQFERNPGFWQDGPSFREFGVNDLLRIKEILEELFEFEKHLKTDSLRFCRSEVDFETGLHFLHHLEDIRQLIANLDHDLVFNYVQVMLTGSPENAVWLSNQEKAMLNCFKGAGMETSLASEDLGRFQEALEHAISARRGLIRWIRWELFSKERIFVTRVLIANGLKSNKASFEILLERIDNRLNYEHALSEIKEANWLIDFPPGFRKLDIQNWFFYQKLALKCHQMVTNVRTLIDFIPFKDQSRKGYIGLLDRLVILVERIPTQLAIWSRYLSEKQVRSLLLGRFSKEEVLKSLNRDFDTLVEYHKLRDSFSADESLVLHTLFEQEEPDKIAIFENSLALAWIDHIEAKHPILRAVSSLKLEHLVKELNEAIEEKKKVSREILLLKVREGTYTNVQYNRQHNPVTYRELHHQVTKKRQIWPIRRVISHYNEELFALLPCWLASPESASALFPMEELFDLVIFDEASQCFAERGVPAMYRGKQVVIAGDDKQLQPHDLYQARWDEENPEEVVLEMDSLLSLAKNYLDQFHLTGHYRSKSLELIDFSNSHFYRGSLSLLPDFETVNKREPAIQYLKVDGIWAQNQNQTEADTVVALINQITQKEPTKSIGVVTFNAPQQALIMDMLDQKFANVNYLLPDSLFVKNIENVQGDEKDIIIFSIGYAPDKSGKVNLQFGSLNRAGGENRLNVAITRARERIYMVTSLLPGDLKTENSHSEGPKLLGLYLEYAWKVSNRRWKVSLAKSGERGQHWYLKNRLSSQEGDMEIAPALPFADLTVQQGDEYRGLIMTDDDLYYQGFSAKEVHSYRPHHFRIKRWPHIQFFSREYWAAPELVKDKLDRFLHRISE